MARLADVTLDDDAIDRLLTSPAGPVGEYLSTLGLRVYTVARNLAPISPAGSHGRPPGHLKTEIYWELQRDTLGLYVDIGSPARTGDGRNAPYGLFQSIPDLRGPHGGRIKTTPHLQPALESVLGSL